MDGYDFHYEKSLTALGKASLLSIVRVLDPRICTINDYKLVILR